MSLPKLTQSRLNTLKSVHDWNAIKDWPRHALRLLARTDVALQKQKFGPEWFARRLALLRQRILRQPEPPPPMPRVPDRYRNTKISNWIKDHNRRLTGIIEDSACQSATDLHDWRDDYTSACRAVDAFNAHMAPIAALYGFKLEMSFGPRQKATGWVTDIRIVKDGLEVVEPYALMLHGDVSKALSVLTFLSTERRTPEIDWMLDIVTLFGLDPPPEGWWKRVWNRLRHAKRGREWRKAAKLLDHERQRKRNLRILESRDPGPATPVMADDRDADTDLKQSERYTDEGKETDDPAANDEFQPKKGFLDRHD